MVDIHCHILPRLDDGARSLEESVEMARLAAASGVERIAATPHFPGTEASLQMLPRILQRLNRVQTLIQAQKIPVQLIPGAEVLCLPDTIELANRDLLPTLGASRYLLTEFYFDTPGSQMDAMLQALEQADYIPVVAHPERYDAVRKRPGLAMRWYEKGYVIQLNKGSVLGAFGADPERCALELLRQGSVHVIASDAHRMDRRTTDLGLLRTWAEEHLGTERTDLLLRDNPGRIAEGRMLPLK